MLTSIENDVEVLSRTSQRNFTVVLGVFVVIDDHGTSASVLVAHPVWLWWYQFTRNQFLVIMNYV